MVIFHSYVSLPEGNAVYVLDVCLGLLGIVTGKTQQPGETRQLWARSGYNEAGKKRSRKWQDFQNTALFYQGSSSPAPNQRWNWLHHCSVVDPSISFDQLLSTFINWSEYKFWSIIFNIYQLETGWLNTPHSDVGHLLPPWFGLNPEPRQEFGPAALLHFRRWAKGHIRYPWFLYTI